MNVFFDSSALAKRYVDEPGSDTVQMQCQQADRLVVCVIVLPEVISGLRRMYRKEQIRNPQYQQAKQALIQDVEDAFVCDLTFSVIRRSIELLEENTLRAMDALHLAAALEWETTRFVTGDQRQLEAARNEDLEVIDVFNT